MSVVREVKPVGLASIVFVILCGLAAVVIVGALSGDRGARSLIGAAPSTEPNLAPTAEATFAASDVPADTLNQLAKAAPGTIIIPCSPSQPVRPDGAYYSINPGWFDHHPGFLQLKHGYCADNPSATPLPDNFVVVQAP